MWKNAGGDGGYDQGGGYLNSPNVGGSQQPQQKNRQQQRAQSILPCTVGQINKAEQVDDKFIVDGIELNQVVLVGLVRTSNETSTRLDYHIDDMTGAPIEVRQFVDNDENTPEGEKTSLVHENIYVRVHGHVRAFGGKRSIVAFRVTPIPDFNEVTTHILEVVHSHATLTRGPVQDTSSAPAAAVNGNSKPIIAPADAVDSETVTTPPAVAVQPEMGLDPQQQLVLNIIRSTMDEHGMSIAVISSHLKAMSQKAIREVIEFLSGEGHIYSTVDDEHFKATDS